MNGSFMYGKLPEILGLRIQEILNFRLDFGNLITPEILGGSFQLGRAALIFVECKTDKNLFWSIHSLKSAI